VSDAADVDAALRAAAGAFPAWRDSTPAQRSLALLRFADAIEARAQVRPGRQRLDPRPRAGHARSQGTRLRRGLEPVV
jgi:hypothetical protein